MLSRSVLTNCLLDLIGYISAVWVLVDGIGSHWFVTRTHVQGRIRRLVSFLEYSTHGHACELSSTLEHLLDGINEQPTETRVKLPIVRL